VAVQAKLVEVPREHVLARRRRRRRRKRKSRHIDIIPNRAEGQEGQDQTKE
jgi:hypothetical protein